MTILEAKYYYGTKTMYVSKGTTLLSLARQLYDSDDYKFQNILASLNYILDETNMQAGEVEYFTKQVCEAIDEKW